MNTQEPVKSGIVFDFNEKGRLYFGMPITALRDWRSTKHLNPAQRADLVVELAASVMARDARVADLEYKHNVLMGNHDNAVHAEKMAYSREWEAKNQNKVLNERIQNMLVEQRNVDKIRAGLSEKRRMLAVTAVGWAMASAFTLAAIHSLALLISTIVR